MPLPAGPGTLGNFLDNRRSGRYVTCMDHETASAKLRAIAHPARLQMLKGLLRDECNVSRIQKRLGLPQSTISQHLAVLKNQGIIKGRRDGNRVCYQVVDAFVKKVLADI